MFAKLSKNQKLWAVGSVILISAFSVKQLMWHKISEEVQEIRTLEHGKAVNVLKSTRENSIKYNLAPLTEEQKRGIVIEPLKED